jgi:Leucine-rich repeat (LRR) protein
MRLSIVSGVVLLAVLTVPSFSPAQTSQPTGLADGWEQIDQRFQFLSARLSSLEASLTAIDKRILIIRNRERAQQGAAQNYQLGNELMDRNAGGPIGWQDFYGQTANRFFFHGTDVPNRPPQFDFIYRANANAQDQAESDAEALGDKLDILTDRRQQLEEEQSALWCEISFQGVVSEELSDRPIYRFDLKTSSTDPMAADQLEAMRAACEFVRLLDHLSSQAETGVITDQGAVYTQWQQAVSAGRRRLEDRLLNLKTMTLDLSDTKNPLTTFAAAGKRLDESADNLKDSWAMIQEADQAHDHQQKNMGRGQLQQALMDTVTTIVTLDQCVSTTANQWNIAPQPGTPAPSQQLPDIGAPAASETTAAAPPVPTPAPQSSAPPEAPVPVPVPADAPSVPQQAFDPATNNAAMQILAFRGNLTLEVDGRERMVLSPQMLPDQPYDIVGVSFHSQRRVSDQDLLNCLRGLRSLQKLDLAFSNISDASLNQILPNLPQLQRLDLDFTRITDLSAPAIGQLTNLTYLSLSRTDITDAGLARLAGLAQLQSLFLTQTRISDQSVEVLSNFRRLRLLQAVQTQLTPDGAAAIRQSMPQCLVAHS